MNPVFQTFVNHRSFPPSQAHQKQGCVPHKGGLTGPFPPPELPGFIGTSDPLRLPDGPPPFLTTFARAVSSDHPGSPPLTTDYLSDMLCSLPRWTGSVLFGYRNGALPRRALPHPFCLPRSCGGSASTLPLSRPAQALHVLRPARLLAHQ